MDTRSIAYKRPVVLLLDNSDAFVRRVIREECNPSTNVDWRAEKLKDFIDSHSAGDLQGDWIAYIRASNTTLVQDLDRDKRQKIRKE